MRYTSPSTLSSGNSIFALHRVTGASPVTARTIAAVLSS